MSLVTDAEFLVSIYSIYIYLEKGDELLNGLKSTCVLIIYLFIYLS